MAQTDFKKLVAYSSISHMGYVLLGIAVWSAPEHAQYWAWGMNGAMFQMIAHGITLGRHVLPGRRHLRPRPPSQPGQLPRPVRADAALRRHQRDHLLRGDGSAGHVRLRRRVHGGAGHLELTTRLFAVLAALTVVITAAYILWTLQRVFMGENPQYKNYPDITVREIVCIMPLVVLSVALGVLPGYLLLNWMEPSVTGLVDTLARFTP